MVLREPRSSEPGPDDAPQVLHRTLRDLVAPGLRKLGFRGSGRQFRLGTDPDQGHALLGIQGWPYNDHELDRFTVNVAYFSVADWEAIRSVHGLSADSRPRPNVYYPDELGWSERIGYLAEPGHDHWWGVRDEEDARVVAADVVRQVEHFVVPHLRARMEGRTPPPTFGDGPGVRCSWPDCDAADDDWDADWDDGWS